MTDLGEALFTTPEMAAIFSGDSFVQRMLDVEAALARAEAQVGVIPRASADAIAASCRADRFDTAALFRETVAAGTPAIPLVRMLTALVPAAARPHVHWGATSQDIVDTAAMLQMRNGLDLLAGELEDIAARCAALADRYRRTPMAGRTLTQHAVPITFGLKAARWLAQTTRLIHKLRGLRDRALVVQFGGAAGTLAALGDQGVRVMEALARELGLASPDLPWHTERDRIADVATALGIVAGAMGKIATDLALLAQTEVSEVSVASPAGGGGSSTMPHKRNPVEATAAIASARLAIGLVPTVLSATIQEHERAVGGWQTEWQAVPDMFSFTAGAVQWVRRALGGLQVDADRMRRNLDLTGGLIMAEALTMALAPALGRTEAYRVVQRLSDQSTQTKTPLRELAVSDEQVRTVLQPDAIAHVFNVTSYMGGTDALIDRALADYRALGHQ
jgi:3-carboxy-cis,cis-muconate cycloisomerase